MLPVNSISLVASQGIEGNGRYFGRTSSTNGQPSRRQVSLIERETLSEHAAALHVDDFAPGAVRSNIETEGVNLMEFIGKKIRVGSAVLEFYAPRDPCSKMEALASGLKVRMMKGRQGVLATVLTSGVVRVGDTLSPTGGEAMELPSARTGSGDDSE